MYPFIFDGEPVEMYGMPRRSGRYPYGSGKDPYQGSSWYASYKADLASGMTQTEIAKKYGISTTVLRSKISIGKNEELKERYERVNHLKEKGYSIAAIAKETGIPEATVRSTLNSTHKERVDAAKNTADYLKKELEKHPYLDVGEGVELQLGVSDTKLATALSILQDEGYEVTNLSVNQVTNTGKRINMKVLTKGGVTSKELYQNRGEIMSPKGFSDDNGLTFRAPEKPKSIDSKRVAINYGDKGGAEKDGLIELRPGISDISLGKARYAQVRIGVDDDHYLKGMAVYGDPKDFPPGVDVIFNTNKKSGTPKMDVLKPMKTKADGSVDWENPFGATIKGPDRLILAQRYYDGADGKKHQSAINVVNEEGTWSKYNKTIASQFLAKQPPAMAKKQLGIYYDSKKQEYDDIMQLTNPSVKRKLLESLASKCDSAAVDLDAAKFPRSSWHVLIPVPSLKSDEGGNTGEIYAPNYKNGEEVIAIRYPHAGTFEIPVLKVNNNNKDAKRILGNAPDAVAINSKVAAKLSGADFDGDTVLVIPTKGQKFKTSKTLEGLKGFNPSDAYPLTDKQGRHPGDAGYNGRKVMDEKYKQIAMGKISNLITDMTIEGATPDELARAVRHSMVVIDAPKHKLDYKKSYEDNGIEQLQERYQGRKPDGKLKGASTLISKAKSPIEVPYRKKAYHPDPETGEIKYIEKGGTKIARSFVKDENGKPLRDEKGDPIFKTRVVPKTSSTTRMAEAKDALALSTGTPIENIYGEHANRLKALANECRKAEMATKNIPYSPSAKKTYQKEVDSLNAKLIKAKENAPLERQANLIASKKVGAEVKANPDLRYDKDKYKKAKTQAMTAARALVGAKRNPITITDKEWEAIQAGAISPTKLDQILEKTDLTVIKQYATPRSNQGLTPAKRSRAVRLLNSGYTQSEVAEALDVSVSAINDFIATEKQ